MKNFKYFNKISLNQILSERNGETKLGEKIAIPSESNLDMNAILSETDAKFVVYGIKEFAGIKANFGRPGEKHSWDVFLPTFLNIQNNKFLKGHYILVLGCFDYTEYEEEVKSLNPNESKDLERLYQIVYEIDKDITYINTLIHRANKKSIIIGGGHNNAYGNIKGLALAKGIAVNVVNFDAHTDFRALEGRHSGNGFSYAFDEGFIKNYYAFGVHENYLNKFMLHQFKEHWEQLKMFTFEEMKIRFEKDFMTSLNNVSKSMKSTFYGIELDVDAVENIASSAMTSCGFSTTEARQFINFMACNSNASYLHICEGSASLSSNPENMLGKFITYLVTDFIKAQVALTK